jgi:hypothetical protein
MRSSCTTFDFFLQFDDRDQMHQTAVAVSSQIVVVKSAINSGAANEIKRKTVATGNFLEN